jgi:hypothetical protein
MAKKKRSAKQKANDKRLGALAKKRAKSGKKTGKKRAKKASKKSAKRGSILHSGLVKSRIVIEPS